MTARKTGFAWSGLTATAAMVLGGGAWAQCVIDCPTDAFIQIDGCGDNPDPNGGCNVIPTAYQDVDFGSGSTLTVCGTVGTFGTSSRDLDWYRFTLTEPAYVRLSVVNLTDGGSGPPANNITMFIREGDDCATAVTRYAAASGACPFVSPLVLLPAGEHVFIVTVNAFAPNPPACEVEYVATLTKFTGGAACFTSTNNCLTDNTSPGCSVFSCCALVCDPVSGLPACCDTAWDAFCASYAELFCNIFVYSCDAPAYPNDCATNPQSVAIDDVIAFNNTGANTDGPPADCDYFADLWYLVLAPDDGEMQINVTSPTWDSTIAVYALGTSSTVVPEELPNQLIGCVDVAGIGGEVAVLIDAAGGEYYLVQVGAWVPDGLTGPGELEINFRRLIYSTGNTNAVQFASAGNCVYSLVNLGWSSGKVSAALTQRWTAAAFTVPVHNGSAPWLVQRIHAYGFSPAGVTNQTLNWRIYKRTSFTAVPTDADLVASGSVPFPTPYDIAGGATNENHEIAVDDVELIPGDYWLTVYADNALGPGVFANFAWFTNASNGIPSVGLGTNPDLVFQWRSTQYPVPGYLVYTLPDCTLAFANGPRRYNPGFRILGVKAPNPCSSNGSADFNNSGCVDGADLGTLLGTWGPAGGLGITDLNCSGAVDGADLGILLGQWGCP